ncbi:MAG: hypothetical protein QXW00_04355 [Candidatus Woesearchaeota archaeon]
MHRKKRVLLILALLTLLALTLTSSSIAAEESCSGVQKHTWDGVSGCCLEASQCLVDPSGNLSRNGNVSAYFSNDKPRCVNSGQFILDHYCDDGNWVTRTSLVAAALLNYTLKNSISNYTLFCDNYSYALNYYSYNPAANYFSGRCYYNGFQIPCTNSFCVLEYSTPTEKRVILGTALNWQLNNQNYSSMLEIINKSNSFCNNALSGGNAYKKCQDSTTWYNPELQTIIFSKTEFNFEPTGASYIINAIVSFLKRILNSIFGREENPTPEYSPLNSDRIYLASIDGKRVEGTIQNWQGSISLNIKYSKFKTDMCSIINKAYPQLNPCTEEEACTYLISASTESWNMNEQYQDLLRKWPDLTAALRIGESPESTDKCHNCVRDFDELGVDCGGSCRQCRTRLALKSPERDSEIPYTKPVTINWTLGGEATAYITSFQIIIKKNDQTLVSQQINDGAARQYIWIPARSPDSIGEYEIIVKAYVESSQIVQNSTRIKLEDPCKNVVCGECQTCYEGSCISTCTQNQVCYNGQCCTPSCPSASEIICGQYGSDGCGNNTCVIGTKCDSGKTCQNGVCISTCQNLPDANGNCPALTCSNSKCVYKSAVNGCCDGVSSDSACSGKSVNAACGSSCSVSPNEEGKCTSALACSNNVCVYKSAVNGCCDNVYSDSACFGKSLNDNCGVGPCVPDCSCASNTCTGSTCSDGCGGSCAGTKDCGGGNGNSCNPPCDANNCETCVQGRCVGCNLNQKCENGECKDVTCVDVGCNEDDCQQCNAETGLCESKCSSDEECDGRGSCVPIDKCKGVTCSPCYACNPNTGACEYQCTGLICCTGDGSCAIDPCECPGTVCCGNKMCDEGESCCNNKCCEYGCCGTACCIVSA